MSISNINITTPNGTNTYSVKAPAVPVPGYDYEQCSPSQATGIAVLRYSPSVAEVVAGEYYANSSELIKYLPFTIEYNYISVDYINIYIKKHSDVTWLLYGKELPASGQSTFALLPSDFSVGDDIDVKIEDADDATVLDVIENQHVYITLTIDTYPAFTYLATNFSVSGKANIPDGSEITVRLTSIEGGLKERTAIVSSGAWSITDYQLLVADGFSPNQNISILAYYIDEVIDFKSETDAFGTIATFNLNAIGNQTAGVAFDVAGTTDLPDGAEVEVFAGATSKGYATVASGAWTKSVTIAIPANGVVMKAVDKLNANAYDTETIDVASGELVVDDFEQYTIGEDPIVDGPWSRSVYYDPPSVSRVIDESGDQVWEMKDNNTSKKPYWISIPQANYNGKTLKIRAKGLVWERTYIQPMLLYGGIYGSLVFTGTNTRIYNTDYTEFTWSITYNGDVDTLQLDMKAEFYSLYLADVIIV